MDADLYQMIFKRKSFHLFRGIGKEHLTKEEIAVMVADGVENVIRVE